MKSFWTEDRGEHTFSAVAGYALVVFTLVVAVYLGQAALASLHDRTAAAAAHPFP